MINTYSRYGLKNKPLRWKDRTPLIGVLLAVVGVIFVGRLFYIQIIKHDDYKAAAIAEQLKKFSIPAERGTISLLDGEKELPIVLNETRYLIYADPVFIKKPQETAEKLQPLIGGDVNNIKEKLTRASRYVVLAKKIDESIKAKISALKLPGIVSMKQRFRTYPEGQMAAQVLGFVNYDGEGQYGIEGYLNSELAGKPGLLKAITDVRGVPLAGNSENIVDAPVPGKNVVLTLDSTIQSIAENAIKNGVEKTKANSGSVVIMDINTGRVKGMANWPSFEPQKFEEVTDLNLFKNRAVTDPLEPGSVIKTLVMGAGNDLGLINEESTYFDQGSVVVDGHTIKNGIYIAPGVYNMFDVIRDSLNTGSVSILKLMGGGEINEKARTTWHHYLTDQFQFGKKTGVEQVNEAKGIVPDPIHGYARNLTLANTTYGYAISITMVQLAAAVSSAINGGTYYQPTVLYSLIDAKGNEVINEPKIVKQNVISASASKVVVDLMERYAASNNRETARAGFSLGGKTGSAEIALPEGGYKPNSFNGTYVGFVGGSSPQYVVALRVDEPKISGSAGAVAARPIFTEIANNMMDSLPFSRGL